MQYISIFLFNSIYKHLIQSDTKTEYIIDLAVRSKQKVMQK